MGLSLFQVFLTLISSHYKHIIFIEEPVLVICNFYNELSSRIILLPTACAKVTETTEDQKNVTKKITIALLYVNNAKTIYDEELTSKINTWLDGEVISFRLPLQPPFKY